MGYPTSFTVHVLFILFSLLPHPTVHLRTSNITDAMALLAFREGIQDPDNVLSNWNESTDVCHWIGITCNDTSRRVNRLVLYRRSLHGTISPFLSNLSRLQVLDLSYNFLRGSIPGEIGALSDLRVISLRNNKLQHTLPDNLGMLANLLYLDLPSNELEGKLPPPIFHNCTNLEYVDLSNNSFGGSIPLQIGTSLNRLRSLFLARNSLIGSIPASLSNATNLTRIAMHMNSLSGGLPSEIVVHMPALKSLSLSYNKLSSDEEGEELNHFFRAISNLTHLEELEIAGNDLRGTLPSMAGLLHVNLSLIFLQDNRIRGAIPSDVSNIRNLTSLNLSRNLLEGTIPLQLFLLPKIERIWISDNLLHGELPSLPDISTKLGSLDLSRNRLSGRIPSSLSKLRSMRHLLLGGNLLAGSIPSSLGSMKLEKLNLSHNRLTGAIPAEVASLSTMAFFFDLSHNSLQGMLPKELSKMEMVQEIDLSSNNLSGSIPPEVGVLCRNVHLLNLSHNSLQGPIPETFGNLRNLESLDLSFNSLSGGVPQSLGNCINLKRLNLSYNRLSGALPCGGVFDNLTQESLEGNEPCGVQRFRTCHSTHSLKFLVSLVSIIFMVLLFLTITCVAAAKARRGTAFLRNGVDGSWHSANLSSRHRRVTYRELWEATGGFHQSRLIGSGGFGHVYRAMLSDGSSLAVKVLQLQDHNSARTFNRECEVLKTIRHRNLMGITTACSLPEFKALVFPFMSEGSLEDHLHPKGDRMSPRLSLTERVSICSDVAEGMAYLHHHAPVQVIHCDLKPGNILLADDMTAMVSDFGIARLVSPGGEGNASSDRMTNSTTNLLRGSIGYVAPEYGHGRTASTKGDVYSFGIVVLEMVTGKRPTEDMFNEDLSLIDWVKRHYGSRLVNIVDSSLVKNIREQSHEVKRVWEVAIMEMIELGLLCTQEAPASRPTMISVADDLNKLKDYLGGDTTATLASSQGVISSIVDIGDDW
ncbi:hypothetical protein C4D60_Mb04t05820 [Musa balbisiana]|uniref:non-specific serine/threonine protein kinase n=1 Tax=Musa balbisiana TaxID=52838 RepID=A0A4V4H9J4_MUSBA|nr:hypothetical protein C4D60_Mb04t05820 [Musa balbisiana]